jgi:ABC-type transport system substrate-binding protein
VLSTLITGVDYTNLNYEYQAVMLTQMPTIENGAATNNTVEVREGEGIVDADGNPVELKPGVRIRDADGNEIEFTSGTAQMKQFVVKYEFVNGLTWSDGVPVSKADYEQAQRILCDPVYEDWFYDPPDVCEKVSGVEFASDTAYVVTWKPGYQDSLYFRPPFPRLPAHQRVSDGRTLADVPTSQWGYIEDVLRTPLGVGPYVLKEWTNGQRMVFAANPYYYQGQPATPNIVVRFIYPDNWAIAALVSGEVDILDAETLTAEHAPQLLEAQAAGKVRVYLIPVGTWEHIDFALFVK